MNEKDCTSELHKRQPPPNTYACPTLGVNAEAAEAVAERYGATPRGPGQRSWTADCPDGGGKLSIDPNPTGPGTTIHCAKCGAGKANGKPPPDEAHDAEADRLTGARISNAAGRAMAGLQAVTPGVRFVACKQKGDALEKQWQDAERSANPALWGKFSWPAVNWYAVVPSTCGLYLVDADSAMTLHEGEEGNVWVERTGDSKKSDLTREEAQELANALGGTPMIYESSEGANKWHILYRDAANGGQDWRDLDGASRAGYASQGGLLFALANGDLIKFDVRGGGVYPEGHSKAGKVCGCRIDADERRLGILREAALDGELTPIANPEVIVAAERLAKTIRGKLKAKDGDATRGAKIAPSAESVHAEILERTSRIAWLPLDEHDAALRELKSWAGARRPDRDTDSEIERAYEGSMTLRRKKDAEQERLRVAEPADLPDAHPWSVNANEHQLVAGHWLSENEPDFLYDFERKSWRAFSDGRWIDGNIAAETLMARQVNRLGVKGKRDYLNGALHFAHAAEGMSVYGSTTFDQDPNLIGVPNGGVIDLSTGELRDGRREDYVTMAMRHLPKGDGGLPPTWSRALNETFALLDDGEDAIRYLLWWAADAMHGRVELEHTAPMLHGLPASGKSLISNAIFRMFGDYAASVAYERLTGESNHHRAWIARLQGKRLLLINEMPPGAKWKAADFNALISGDPIEANLMRSNPFDFVPVAHCLLAGNHRPQTSNEGILRRIACFPCNRQVPRNNRDSRLGDKLDAEGPAMMAHLLTLIGQDAPKLPESVTAANAEYEREANPTKTMIEDWIEDELDFEVAPTARVEGGELRSALAAWMERNGHDSKFQPSPRTLGPYFRERGAHHWRANGKNGWEGVAFKNPF